MSELIPTRTSEERRTPFGKLGVLVRGCTGLGWAPLRKVGFEEVQDEVVASGADVIPATLGPIVETFAGFQAEIAAIDSFTNAGWSFVGVAEIGIDVVLYGEDEVEADGVGVVEDAVDGQTQPEAFLGRQVDVLGIGDPFRDDM